MLSSMKNLIYTDCFVSTQQFWIKQCINGITFPNAKSSTIKIPQTKGQHDAKILQSIESVLHSFYERQVNISQFATD